MFVQTRAAVLAPLLLWMFAAPLAAQDAANGRTMRPIRVAITVDDLPGSAVPSIGTLRMVSEIARVLAAHRVTPATGFAIGSRLESDPEGRAALEVWTAHGHELGNHSYAHTTPEQVGAAAYFADVVRMDALLRTLDAKLATRTRYFRYPYLEEGRDARESKDLFRSIVELGYQVARVSLDFSDWAYADPYARCLARNDERALELLAQSYVESAVAQLAWAVAAAQSVARRPFVQVLLLHANVATMHNLDALLTAYEKAGVQFVSLAEALKDPLYTADYEASGGSVLTMAGLASGRALPPHLVRPLPLLELACR